MSKITDCIDCNSRYSPRISFGASRMEEKRLVSWIEVVMVTPMMVARALIIVMGSGIFQDDYVGLKLFCGRGLVGGISSLPKVQPHARFSEGEVRLLLAPVVLYLHVVLNYKFTHLQSIRCRSIVLCTLEGKLV